MVLCRLCSSLDFGTAAREVSLIQPQNRVRDPKHYKSLRDLETSADNGCQLCQLLFIYGAIPTIQSRRRAHRPVHQDHDLDQIVYRAHDNSRYYNHPVKPYGVTEIEFYLESELWGPKEKPGFPVALGIFADYDSLAAKSSITRGRPIAEQPDSQACYEQIHAWMRECIKDHHETCPRPQDSAPLPTRVIDVCPAGNSERPKLLETHGQAGTFVALSHCWGTRARCVLDSQTRTEFLTGIGMETLPPTFRDAVRVTRALGHRYLWIDSLCILQDSFDDWDIESSRMRDYYKNAILTIAADDTEGDHDGFLDRHRFSDKNAIAVPFRVSKADEKGKLNSTLSDNRFVYFSHERREAAPRPAGGHLVKRGWTLQEDILAVRTIHYENRWLRWECQKHRRVESLAGEFSTWDLMKYMFLQGPENPVTGNERSWYKIIQRYLHRNLTLREDKFPAISGIVSEITKRTGFAYLAGIWLEDIHIGLAWYLEGIGDKSGSYIAPSWSWASFKMPINYPIYIAHFDNHSRGVDLDFGAPMPVELIASDITLRGKDAFGQITHATILLRGLWLQLSDWKAKYPIRIGTSFGLDSKREGTWSIDCNFDETLINHGWNIENESFVVPKESILDGFYLFHISMSHSPGFPGDVKDLACSQLILMPTKTEGQFRRVGLARAQLKEFEAAGEWEVREATIV